MKSRNIENRKEDYVATVAIRRHWKDFADEPLLMENVRCKVYLPERITDRIFLVFQLEIEQYRILDALGLWRFAIEGEENHVPGHRTRISAKNVYRTNLTATHWSPEVIEAELIAEPADLKREHTRSPDTSEVSIQTHGRYWLTANRLLSPAQTVSRSYTGEVTIETVWKVTVMLESVPLTFMKRYHYRSTDGETVSWSDLVAEYELTDKAQTFEDVYQYMNDLDDVLRFSSLAARNSCVCVGFDFVTSVGYIVDYYRRDVSIPTSSDSHYSGLIDISNIEEFLTSCYRRFVELGRDDLLRQAINYTIFKRERTVESSFIGLYQALETLVLYYRKKAHLEMVFSEEKEWQAFETSLKQFLTKHPLLENDKGKRRRLKANVPGLQRVPFGEAFSEICEYYGVDLSDLWPVLGPDRKWPLKSIRNKLVHGGTLVVLKGVRFRLLYRICDGPWSVFLLPS